MTFGAMLHNAASEVVAADCYAFPNLNSLRWWIPRLLGGYVFVRWLSKYPSTQNLVSRLAALMQTEGRQRSSKLQQSPVAKKYVRCWIGDRYVMHVWQFLLTTSINEKRLAAQSIHCHAGREALSEFLWKSTVKEIGRKTHAHLWKKKSTQRFVNSAMARNTCYDRGKRLFVGCTRPSIKQCSR